VTPFRIMTPRGAWRDIPVPERRTKMTVCIAASASIGPFERAIVLCSDTRMTSALGTSEYRRKDHWLIKGWFCLMSGEEGDMLALLPLLRRNFRATKEIDETNVCQLVRDALNERKREKIEELVQGRYGFSYEVFLKDGKTSLPEAEFRITMSDISSLRLRVDCLIGGFVQRTPTILVTDGDCGVGIREDFAAIGEGAHLATAMLLHRQHGEADSLNQALYHVFEAKKLAENVKTVGEMTSIIIVYDDDRWGFVSRRKEAGNILQKKFAEIGPQRVPEQVFTKQELKTLLRERLAAKLSEIADEAEQSS
jgi:20S proteasome alpha/beta subunit